MVLAMPTNRVACIAAVTVSLLLTGCSGPPAGTVHDKQYNAGYTQITTQCVPAGKTTVCHPQVIYIPENWNLDIYASKDDHGWVEVDEQTFNNCAIGAEFNHGECR